MPASISKQLRPLTLGPDLLDAVAGVIGPLHHPFNEDGSRKQYAEESYWGPHGVHAANVRFTSSSGARVHPNPSFDKWAVVRVGLDDAERFFPGGASDGLITFDFFLDHMSSAEASLEWSARGATLTVSGDADVVEGLAEQLADALASFESPSPPLEPLRVFIGHGGDRKWEAVRDFVEGAGYSAVAFESEQRASLMTLDVVEEMISGSDVAVIVMTATDQMADGLMRARQNVVHEVGFAQGRIGRFNTILLVEENVERFTNAAGLTEVRFPSGQIHTAREEVLEALALRVRTRAERPE